MKRTPRHPTFLWALTEPPRPNDVGRDPRLDEGGVSVADANDTFVLIRTACHHAAP
jgi:hypothetical protein